MEVGGPPGGRPVKVATIGAKNEEPMLYDGHIGVYSKNRVISIWFLSRLPGDPYYLSARVAVARAGREMLEAARRGGGNRAKKRDAQIKLGSKIKMSKRFVNQEKS